MSDKHKKAIREAIIQAVGRNGQRAFAESKNTVPVDTGELKNSGSFTESSSGITIKYSAEYASSVERGWAGGKVWVKLHFRKPASLVRGHYMNQPPKEGVHFIENSLKIFFKEGGSRTPFQQDFFDILTDLCQPDKVTEE